MLGVCHPGVVAAGVQGRTYAEFVAHITALATDGLAAWPSEVVRNDTVLRKLRTVAAAFSGPLYGSPAAARFAMPFGGGGYNSAARIVQHSLPDGDLSGASAGMEIYFETENRDSNSAIPSKTINGFTSSSLGGGYGTAIVTRILWWSGGRAWWRDPFNNTAPEPYGW